MKWQLHVNSITNCITRQSRYIFYKIYHEGHRIVNWNITHRNTEGSHHAHMTTFGSWKWYIVSYNLFAKREIHSVAAEERNAFKYVVRSILCISSLHCDRSHVRCIEHIWLWASNCLSSFHVWPWPSRLFPLHISDPEHAIVFFYFTCSIMDNRSCFFIAHVWLWSYQQFLFVVISAPERLFLFRMSDHGSSVIFFYCTCLITTVFFYCLYTF